MTMGKDPSTLLLRATVMTQRKYLPVLCRLVHDYALREGLSEEESNHLELVTEEACLNVIQHAFEDRSDQYFDLIVEMRPARFVVAVEDRGLPMDWERIRQGSAEGFGVRLAKAFTDEVQYINLGLKGKRIEFIKDFSKKKSLEMRCEDHHPEAVASDTVSGDVPLDIRLMRSDEGAALARCLYRVYGYSYIQEMYFPEKINDLIESGLQVSMAALNPDREIVAHQRYIKSRPDSLVAELGAGVVDPRYRGRGLFERIKKEVIDYGRSKGLLGLFIESVTAHPYSQKANAALGARETGILLGYAPMRLSFKEIEEVLKQRHTVVLMYNRLNKEPSRKVYPPLRHGTIIAEIYEHGDLQRTFGNAGDNRDDMEVHSHMEVQVNPDLGLAFLTVIGYGKDFQDFIHYHVSEMCFQKIDCIFLDLPLSHPATPRASVEAEMLGFFFAGIVPEMHDGDVMRLAYLNNVQIDPTKIVIASEFGKRLFDYVRQEYAKKLPQNCNHSLLRGSH